MPVRPSDRQGAWQTAAQSLLRARREVLRIEWCSSSLATLAAQDSSYRGPVFAQLARAELASNVALTCSAARRLSGPAYSGSYSSPQPGAPGTQSGLQLIRA